MYAHMYTCHSIIPIMSYILFKSIGSDDACSDEPYVDSISMVASNQYNVTSNLIRTTKTTILPKEGICYYVNLVVLAIMLIWLYVYTYVMTRFTKTDLIVIDMLFSHVDDVTIFGLIATHICFLNYARNQEIYKNL